MRRDEEGECCFGSEWLVVTELLILILHICSRLHSTTPYHFHRMHPYLIPALCFAWTRTHAWVALCTGHHMMHGL